jgi:hypothetical protein
MAIRKGLKKRVEQKAKLAEDATKAKAEENNNVPTQEPIEAPTEQPTETPTEVPTEAPEAGDANEGASTDGTEENNKAEQETGDASDSTPTAEPTLTPEADTTYKVPSTDDAEGSNNVEQEIKVESSKNDEILLLLEKCKIELQSESEGTAKYFYDNYDAIKTTITNNEVYRDSLGLSKEFEDCKAIAQDCSEVWSGEDKTPDAATLDICGEAQTCDCAIYNYLNA